MNREATSTVSGNNGVNKPPKNWMVQRVDTWSHKVAGVQSVNLILLVWVAVSGGISFNNALQEQNNVYSQMHAVPYHDSVGAPPAHYASMDWIMTAKRVMVGPTVAWVGSAVSHELCIDREDKACNPEWWQTHDGCNTSAAVQMRIPPKVVEEQGYFYQSKRASYRHLQPIFTCLAEKIGSVAVYQNNEHSYSIGSTHNANVLVAAVFMIIAVIWATMLLATFKRDSSDDSIYRDKMKRTLLTALVFIYIVATYFSASSVSIDSSKDQHRPIGLASYAYSTVFLILSLFVFNQSGTMRDNMKEHDRMTDLNDREEAKKKLKKNKVAPAQGTAPATEIPYAEADTGYAMGYPVPEQESSDSYANRDPTVVTLPGGSASMSVRRFVNEPMHTETRIKLQIRREGPLPQEGEQKIFQTETMDTVTVDVCALVSSPVHSKFVYGQLLTLPLALMALSMHGCNFGLDTYTQTVFVCAGIFCLVDVFLYRMWWAFQIHKGVTFYQEDDVGEYRAMEVLTVLCLCLQVTIFIFFIVSELFHASYMWFFVVHIILTSLAKILAVMAIRQHKKIFDYGGEAIFSSTNFDKLTGTLQKSDFYMFVVYTILLSIVLWNSVILDQRTFDASWAEKMPLVQRWGPGWQTYNALSI